jgi:putative ABC transport system permease protein
MKPLLIAFDHLSYYRLRTALMLCGVTLAFLAYGMLGALRYSLDSGEESVSGRRLIVTHRAGLMQTLPLAYLERLRKVAGVGEVGHATWQGAYYREPRQMLVALAVDPEVWLRQHPDMQLSEAQARDFLRRRDGMLVSRPLARKFGWAVGDVVPLQSILYPPPTGQPAWSYTVSGIFISRDSGGARNYIVTHYDFLNEARPMWRNTVGTFMVTPDASTPAMELAQRIDAAFADGDTPTSTTTDQAFHAEFFAQFGDVVGLIRMVMAVAFVSLLLVVSSGMALSVRQGSHDIGVLKVIGFSNRLVLSVVLAQSGLLMLSGAALGLGTSALVNTLVTRSLPQFLPDLALPLPVLAVGVLIAVLLALAAGSLPAWIAMRVRPVDAFILEQS